MFFDDASEVFGTWSADESPEHWCWNPKILVLESHFSDPIKHPEIRVTIEFLEGPVMANPASVVTNAFI